MAEDRATRIKRLTMRAERRGMREMDLILGPFARARLHGMDAASLDAFEALLGEPDQELLAWVLGRAPAPAPHAAQVSKIVTFLSEGGPSTLN